MRTRTRPVDTSAAPATADTDRCWRLSGRDTSSKPRRSARCTSASVVGTGSSLDSDSPRPENGIGVRCHTVWIRTVPYSEATGELAAAYERQARALGEPTEMTLAGSLHPPLVSARLDLYAATEKCPSRLTPHQRNLISYVTSALNATPYCMSQVTIKLRQTGFTDEEIVALGTDPLAVAERLPPADAALVRHTVKLTKEPGGITADDIDAL